MAAVRTTINNVQTKKYVIVSLAMDQGNMTQKYGDLNTHNIGNNATDITNDINNVLNITGSFLNK